MLWVVQSASTSGGQRCAAPREMGGANDVTVSNRVNLVDPFYVRTRYKRRWIEVVESDTRTLIFHLKIIRGKIGEIWRSEIAN